jgi:hypothetical protein
MQHVTELNEKRAAVKRSKYFDLSETELASELTLAIGMTATAVLRMAEVVSVMTAKGYKVGAVDSLLVPYLLAVHERRLAAEAFITLSANKSAINAMCNLPLADQRDLIAAGEIRVKSRLGKIEKVPLAIMTAAHAKQVIDPVKRAVIPPSEQTPPKFGHAMDQPGVRVTLTLTQEQYTAVKARADQVNKQVAVFIVDLLKTSRTIK